MVKWIKSVCLMIIDFIKTYPLLCFLIGNIIGAIMVEICFLISCGIYGYPANWPIEWPWNYFLR